MAQTGYTPILIYASTTASQTPLAANLTNSTLGSELAINITDGKLFYKDNANAVQVIAWKTTPTTAGGTGLTSYSAGDLLYYATGTTLSKLAIGTSNQILKSTGSAPAWENVSALAVTSISFGTTGLTPSAATQGAVTVAGTLVAANGGTGQSSYTVGDILYASTTTALSKLADVATGNALISGGVGVAPSWGKIGLTTHVSGTLPIANGGTNQTSFTGKSGNICGLVFFDGTSFQNDSTVAHVGYDTVANTFYANNVNFSGSVTLASALPVNQGGTGITTLTAGYIPYGNGTGAFASTSSLFWDSTNARLGVGTNAPGRKFESFDTNAGGANSWAPTIRARDNNYPNSGYAGIEFFVFGNGNSYQSGVAGIPWRGLGFFQPSTYGADPTESARFDDNRYLLLGYTSSNGAYKLQVNGQIFATSSTIATSDANFKTNVQPIQNALELVKKLKPVQFNWKAHQIHNFDTATPTVGFLAQDVQKEWADQPFINSIVKENKYVLERDPETNEPTKFDPFLGIAEGNMIAILAAALNELRQKFDDYVAAHP